MSAVPVTMRSMLGFIALLFAATGISSPVPSASDLSARISILGQEARWIRAAKAGDSTTLSEILAGNFVHINYRGELEDKATMLARIRSLRAGPYDERTSDQSITIAGGTAIVHGVNSIEQRGRVVFRLRYTDVYVKQQETWRAVSAQETPIAAK